MVRWRSKRLDLDLISAFEPVRMFGFVDYFRDFLRFATQLVEKFFLTAKQLLLNLAN